MRICRCLHIDINKSCFTLRMIFYKNLCGILDNLVIYCNQKMLLELFSFLVRPLVYPRMNCGMPSGTDLTSDVIF